MQTATAFVITATFPPTQTLISTETPLPPLPAPTMTPVEGVTSSQVNVRLEPSTASSVLGMIPADTKIQITGKDPGGNWWQILYSHEQAMDGKGWVTAQYVLTANTDQVPVIGGGKNPDNGNVAIVQQQINVRSGPGTSFNSLGTLNSQDVVNLTGKDSNGAWLQIEFAPGPNGRGWVNAAFVQAKGVENIPIITEAGEAIGTGTPTGIPASPTPTVIPAWADNDSQGNPIVSVRFEPLGTQTLIYNGDVSSPSGDSQDWIQFTPDRDHLFASLECLGEADLQVIIMENGQPAELPLACGDKMKIWNVMAGSVYAIQLQAPQSSGGVQYFQYTITILASP